LISEAVESFLRDQDVRENSRALYRRTLKRFFFWTDSEGLSLSLLQREHVLRYKEHLLASGMSSLSVSSYLTAVRKFYTWTEANKLYPNIAKGVKSPARKQQFKKQSLTPEQSKELLLHLQAKALRDYAIINLLLRTGLRTIEAVRADVEDITTKQGKRVLLVHGKGRDDKDDFVVLTEKAYRPIAEYLKTRGKVRSGEPLFTSDSNNSQGGRLTTRTISHVAKEALRSIGLDSREYTAHSLRHTTAANILKHGGQLTDAQHVLRHSNPATTQIYLASIKEEMRIATAPEELLDEVF
jgi:integrase/recombinase XerC/integrase/recombinase XerD